MKHFPDTNVSMWTDFSSDALAALFSEVASAGYMPYSTVAAGPGLDVFSPWHTPRPPATLRDSLRGETPALNGEAGDDHGKDEAAQAQEQGGSLRSKFGNTPWKGPTQWAEDRPGRWLFV
jgi:hypothetical protein